MKRIGKMFERIGRDIRNVWKYIAAFLIYDAVVQLVFHQFCPSVIVTGLPCPGCGMTRAIFYFATGQFEKGWEMNPLGIFWLALGVYFCVMRYWFGKRAAGVPEIGGILAGCMALFYVYRMYRYFPGNEPVCYTPGNLLERVWPGYENRILTLIGELKKQFSYAELFLQKAIKMSTLRFGRRLTCASGTQRPAAVGFLHVCITFVRSAQ